MAGNYGRARQAYAAKQEQLQQHLAYRLSARGEPSVWTVDAEWDPNTWAPPGEERWIRDRSAEGNRWVDPGSGWSLSWRDENGHGSGYCQLAA